MSDRRVIDDPELDDLFTEPRDRDVTLLLTSIRRPAPEPDPGFRSMLGRRLMEEALRPLAPRPWYRRLGEGAALWGALPGMWLPLAPALGSAARLRRWARSLASRLPLSRPSMYRLGAVAVMAVLALAAVVITRADQGVGVHSPLNHSHAVSVVNPITLTFTQPMDPRTTEDAVEIHPAVDVSYRWTSATTLEIVPRSGAFQPDTRYQVTVRTTARTQDQRTLSQPVQISFETVGPTPTPSATASPTASPSPTPSPSPSSGPSPSPSPSPSSRPSPSPSPSPAESPSPTGSPSPRSGSS